MKGTIKANTVDKYLAPIRQQIKLLVKPQSTVIEFGCGNGDLLCRLSPTIQQGLGFDKSTALIHYAQQQQQDQQLDNLEFKVHDLLVDPFPTVKADVAIVSLVLHVLPWANAVLLLKQMLQLAPTIIVCTFVPPNTLKSKVLLWFDQRFSGHYKHFKKYQANGAIQGLLKELVVGECIEIKTFDPTISIFQVHKV